MTSRRTDSTGELSLWAAVILQAFQDAFAPPSNTYDPERSQALEFLLATSGMWARRREDVAIMAGTEGEHVARTAQAILDGRLTFDGGSDRLRQKYLDEARALWAALRPPPRSTSRGLGKLPKVRARPAPIEPDPTEPSPTPPPINVPQPSGDWLCFDLTRDACIVLPRGRALVGFVDGVPLPHAGSYPGRIMKACARPEGATSQHLARINPDWRRHLKDLCRLYGLEVEMKRGGKYLAFREGPDTTFHLKALLPEPDA